MITLVCKIYADTYGKAIEAFGDKMDAAKDGHWKLISASAKEVSEEHPSFTTYHGASWVWEMKGEWL